jgi:glycosyltransferase involved in cell wall biosynthesis
MNQVPMEISVVVPVLDDREGMRELLVALAAQTRLPDECVVVDGGSTDGTRELLETASLQFPLRLVNHPGRNIAAARNEGIERASFDWVACTDAGCVPASGWLAAMERALRSSEFVAGVFEIEGQTPLTRVLALTHYPSRGEVEDPPAWIRISHRLFGRGYVPERTGGGNVAFSKSVWQGVGGFPEDVYAGEDRAFTSAVVGAGFRVARSPGAVVNWGPPATWAGNAKMFFTYSRGDIRFPGRSRHAARVAAWALAAALMRRGWRARCLLVAGGAAYIALPVHRARQGNLPVRYWWRIPVVVALKDLAQMAGASRGLIDAARGVPQPPPARRAAAPASIDGPPQPPQRVQVA